MVNKEMREMRELSRRRKDERVWGVHPVPTAKKQKQGTKAKARKRERDNIWMTWGGSSLFVGGIHTSMCVRVCVCVCVCVCV